MIDSTPILTLFGLNLETFPDNTFSEGILEVTLGGNFVKNHSKEFKDTTFYIFEKIEVLNIGGICNNIVFTAKGLKKINIYALKKLINRLFEIYGSDERDKGKWETEDFSHFRNKELFSLFSRYWNFNTNYPCTITTDKEDDTLTMVIKGVNYIQ